MRYNVKKYLFIGSQYDKELFFKKVQEAGVIHFIDPNKEKRVNISDEEQLIGQAIKILRTLPVAIQEEPNEPPHSLAKTIVEIRRKLNALNEGLRTLNLEMSRIEMYGDFSLEDLKEIKTSGKRTVQFFYGKQGIAEDPGLPNELIYVGSDHGLDYFVSINTANVQYPKMIEIIIEKPYGQLKQELQTVQKNIHDLEKQLKEFAKYNTFLHHAYINSANEHQLETTKKYVEHPLTDELFVVEGFVPEHKLEAVEQLVKELHVFFEEVQIDPSESIPTYLENAKASKIGEDIIGIYDTPSHTDKDPSLWVLFFFALFFSMIIGDGGYGLILLCIALYIRYKHSAIKGMKKRMLDLFTILSFGCIIWGVLTTSFFGIPVAPDNPIRKASLISWLVEKKTEYHMAHQDSAYKEWETKIPAVKEAKNSQDFLMVATHTNDKGKVSYEAFNKFADQIMMELALLVGIIHLIISMSRYLDRNLINLGWIVFIIGAYLYLPSFLGAASIVNYAFGINQQTAATNGIYMMCGGMAWAVIVALFKHKWLGLIEASTVIQIFGDVLSYLRLYALGLAGSLLTATMLDLSSSVPFFFGALILIFGHAVNIVLGVMGGVIHGLRLNFLEWYHYSFEGGGKLFNPLKKREIE